MIHSACGSLFCEDCYQQQQAKSPKYINDNINNGASHIRSNNNKNDIGGAFLFSLASPTQAKKRRKHQVAYGRRNNTKTRRISPCHCNNSPMVDNNNVSNSPIDSSKASHTLQQREDEEEKTSHPSCPICYKTVHNPEIAVQYISRKSEKNNDHNDDSDSR
eukprot:5988779-Ditylum_brightwellii.AAC.1